MGYTSFYQSAKSDSSKITWRDILSESFHKHSHQDLEYAISTGTIHDRASGDTMLQKWRKPWIWVRLLSMLAVISFILYLMTHVLIEMDTNIPAISWISILFATLVTPLPLMVLLWELNIPRNLSLFSMIGYFVIGGILSLFFSGILFAVGVTGDMAWWAPLAEEPGKLLAGVVLLRMFEKNGKKIYGCTGLAIGAGVGAGFTVFETFGYAFGLLSDCAEALSLEILSQGVQVSASSLIVYVSDSALELVFYRSIPCLAAHLVYCAPYIAALALAYHKTHAWKESFKDMTFLALFGVSAALHAFWNLICTTFSGGPVMLWILKCAIAAGSFAALFYAIRLCLTQAIKEGRYVSGSSAIHQPLAAAQTIAICCKTTALRGTVFQSSGEVLVAGRQKDHCNICFPSETKGVSRCHCRFYKTAEGWFVQDLNSAYGTYAAGKKLAPNESCRIHSGDNIFLGSKQVWLVVM